LVLFISLHLSSEEDNDYCKDYKKDSKVHDDKYNKKASVKEAFNAV